MTDKITADQTGCWLDGHMGWHNHYRVVELAFAYGWQPTDRAEIQEACDVYCASGGMKHADMFLDQGGLVDEATEYLDSIAPEGYYFDWDVGELCLVRSEDEES